MARLIPICISNHAEIWRSHEDFSKICSWNSIWSVNLTDLDFPEGEQGYDYDFAIHMDPDVYAQWLVDNVSKIKSPTDIYKVNEATLALILLQVTHV